MKILPYPLTLTLHGDMMAYVLGYKNQLNFGKFRGMYVESIVKMEPEYIVWVHENTHHRFNKHVLNRAIKFIDNKEKVLC